LTIEGFRLSRRTVAWLALGVACFAAIGSAIAADMKPQFSKLAPEAVRIDAKPIGVFDRGEPGRAKFGKLTFRGGLQLTAPGATVFGGWSGIVLDVDGRKLLAVSDTGAWLKATIDYDGDRPIALSDATVGPLRSLDGSALSRTRDRDAEGLALLRGDPHTGRVLVSFERNARIGVYDVGPEGASPTLRLLPKPAETRQLKSNSGFEAVTVLRGGRHDGETLLIAEALLDRDGNHTGWISRGEEYEAFHLKRIDEYDVTDAASLDDGTLFILERRFRWLDGVRMRIRRIAADDLKAGRTIEGETLIEADMGSEIDNMEGLSAVRMADGRVLLTVISDDNFNTALQRNLLLQFTLDAAGSAQK
jgi:hypothetical protein